MEHGAVPKVDAGLVACGDRGCRVQAHLDLCAGRAAQGIGDRHGIGTGHGGIEHERVGIHAGGRPSVYRSAGSMQGDRRASANKGVRPSQCLDGGNADERTIRKASTGVGHGNHVGRRCQGCNIGILNRQVGDARCCMPSIPNRIAGMQLNRCARTDHRVRQCGQRRVREDRHQHTVLHRASLRRGDDHRILRIGHGRNDRVADAGIGQGRCGRPEIGPATAGIQGNAGTKAYGRVHARGTDRVQPGDEHRGGINAAVAAGDHLIGGAVAGWRGHGVRDIVSAEPGGR